MGEQAFLICHHSNIEVVKEINEKLTMLIANQPVHLDMNNLYTMTVKDIITAYMQEVSGRDYNFRNRKEHTAMAVACLRHSALGMMTILTGYIISMAEAEEQSTAPLGVEEPDSVNYRRREEDQEPTMEGNLAELIEKETPPSEAEVTEPSSEEPETPTSIEEVENAVKEEGKKEEPPAAEDRQAKKPAPRRRLLGIRRE